jgi:hypothetical protein
MSNHRQHPGSSHGQSHLIPRQRAYRSTATPHTPPDRRPTAGRETVTMPPWMSV